MLPDDDIDNAPCLYFTVSDDGNIQYVNQTLCDILGFSKEELINAGVQKIFPVSTIIFYNTHIFPLIKISGHSNEVFAFLQTKSGTQVPTLLNGKRSTAQPGNKFVGIIVETRNKYEQELISAKKTAEKALSENEALIALQTKLKKQSLELDTALATITMRHNELTQLNKVITHDIEEPLRKLFFYSERFKDALNADEILGFDKFLSALHRLKTVVLALQEYIWIDERQLSVENINLNDIISDTVLQLSRIYNMKHVTFNISELPACNADVPLMKKVIYHILDNAVRYSVPGMPNIITVRGSKVKRNAFKISHDNYQYVEYIQINVIDTGRGFAFEGANPFEMFRKFHSEPGLGMGLALSRKIIEKHQGGINLRSRLGEGTEIELFLPCDDGHA